MVLPIRKYSGVPRKNQKLFYERKKEGQSKQRLGDLATLKTDTRYFATYNKKSKSVGVSGVWIAALMTDLDCGMSILYIIESRKADSGWC